MHWGRPYHGEGRKISRRRRLSKQTLRQKPQQQQQRVSTCAWSKGSYCRTRLGRLRMPSCTPSSAFRIFLGTAVDQGVSSSSAMLSQTFDIASHTCAGRAPQKNTAEK